MSQTITAPAPTALPEGITEREILRYAKMDAAIKKLQPQHKVLNEKIKTAFVAVGTFIVGTVVVKRTEADAFDAAAAAKRYPYDRYPEFYVPVFDKDLLPADVRGKFTSKTQRLSVSLAQEVVTIDLSPEE